MSYSVDIKNQLATFQFEVSAESFAHELEKEIFRSKDKMNLSVYRDGKIPPEVMQEMYDRNEMLKRVINTVIGNEYDAMLNETGYVALTAPVANVCSCAKNEPFKFTVETILMPDVSLCEYHGVEVKKPDFTVPDSDVEIIINKFLQQNAKTIEITDRTVEDGDHIYIDFEGFLHGRSFKGNKADNFPLRVGSHSFVPGFEEQLIGVGINEAKDFTITYPEDYRMENLAGQDVVFRCIVRRITKIEIPVLDDEFVKANTKFEDVDTYRDNVRKSLELQKRIFELKNKENAVLKTLIDGSDVQIPDQLIKIEVTRVDQEQLASLKKQGLTLEKHLKMTGQTEQGYHEQVRDLAAARVKTRLVLLAIAQKEQLEVTEEDYKKEIANLAKIMNKSEEAFRHPFSIQQVGNELKIQKALLFVMEQSIEK